MELLNRKSKKEKHFQTQSCVVLQLKWKLFGKFSLKFTNLLENTLKEFIVEGILWSRCLQNRIGYLDHGYCVACNYEKIF